VRRKVEKSMQSVEAGRLLSSEQVEAEFAKKRAELLRRAAEKRD